jgi:hypothetical protein
LLTSTIEQIVTIVVDHNIGVEYTFVSLVPRGIFNLIETNSPGCCGDVNGHIADPDGDEDHYDTGGVHSCDHHSWRKKQG